MDMFDFKVTEGYDSHSGLKFHRVMYGASIFAECYGVGSKKTAELFAAAPKLLKALQNFVDHGTCFDDEDLRLAREAIKEAKGEI